MIKTKEFKSTGASGNSIETQLNKFLDSAKLVRHQFIDIKYIYLSEYKITKALLIYSDSLV